MKLIKFFSYYGSKTYLLEDIYKIVLTQRHRIKCFVDVFGGSGIVVLNLPLKNVVRVYNDIDKFLYYTFKVLQDPEKRKILLEKLELAFPHREIFEEFKEIYWNSKTENLSDVDIAFIFIYLTQTSYNADMKNYGANKLEYRNLNLNSSISKIKQFAEELRNIIIENLDYREVIEKYDSENTFFYLDPPYLYNGDRYKHGGWTIHHYKILKKTIDKIKGMWLLNLSENNFEDIVKIFGEPKLVKEYTTHADILHKLNTGITSSRKEGFWFNFEIIKESKKNLNSFILIH